MAIKAMEHSEKTYRDVKRTVTVEGKTLTVTDRYYLTTFVADTASDVTAMNAAGSVYLNYPAGSVVIVAGTGKGYILNASETAYREV